VEVSPIKVDINTHKRPRSESTPPSFTDRQKIRKSYLETEENSTQTDTLLYENDNHIQQCYTNVNNTCENLIEETLEALANIYIFSENTELKENDFPRMRKTCFQLHRSVSGLIYKLGQLEKENMILKKCETPNSSNDSKEPKENFKQSEHVKTTYATIANSQPVNTLEKSKTTVWTTPKVNKKLETIIRIDDVNDPKEATRKLRNELKTNDIDGGFKNIRHLKDGAIIVESCSATQQQKLKQALQPKQHIKLKDHGELDPMFVITGIEKGYTNEDFLTELVRLNNEIETEIQGGVSDKIRVVTKKQCRNPYKENWILQAPANIAKWFLKKETVHFDLLKVYVQEHINLAMCFKCSGFGHVAKHCKEKLCCHKCGEEHAGKDCQAVRWKCPNCNKMKFKTEESIHSARDTSCPVYQRRLALFRNNINYSSSFLP